MAQCYFFVLFLLIFCTNAFAAGSGSYRLETPDAAAMGKGSAFVGEANTPAAVYYNPAGLTQIQNVEISVGSAIIAPRGNYKSNSGQETQMRNNEFIVPHIYAVAPINQKLVFGVGTSSYWGLGTDWAKDSFSRYVATRNDLQNTDTMLTASYKVTDRWSVAAGADNDYSKADKNKMLFQGGAAGSDGNLALKAKDDAWGYRLATMFKINEKNQIGLMYRSAIHHNYDGKVYLDNLNNVNVLGGGTFSYQTAFGGSSYETRVTQKLVLPQSIVMGYSFKPTNKWTFNFDLEWFDWSRNKQSTLNFPDATGLAATVLNASGTTNDHWHSTFSESIGGEYAATEKLRLRAGYYHHAHTIPQGTFNSAIPDSDSHGITTGFGYDLTRHLTLDVAYSGLIYESRKVNNDVGTLVGQDISGKYRQYTNIGLITLTYKF